MPVLHPAEPWRRTGRYDIEEVFKLKDRRGADMVLALTHEEIVTGHVATAVKAYRDLGLIEDKRPKINIFNNASRHNLILARDSSQPIHLIPTLHFPRRIKKPKRDA